MPKGQAPKKSVDELLSAFDINPQNTESEAELKRRALSTEAEAGFASFAGNIVETTRNSDDTDAIKGALQSLVTAKQRTLKAIKAIDDKHFLGEAVKDETPAVL